MTAPTKTIEVDASLYDLDGMTVDGLVAWAEAIRNQVPQQYREASRLDYKVGGYDESESLRVRYKRPETDEDRRLDRERRERERREYEARRHAEEYATYERLRAKYEKR